MWDAAREQLERDVSSGHITTDHAREWWAWIYCSTGDLVRARLICEQAEGNMRLQPIRAIIAASDSDLESARQYAQQAVESRRDRAELAMAHVMRAIGDKEAAVYWFERAANRPEAQQPLRSAARLLAELGS